MKHRWMSIVLCITSISLTVQKATAAFPNFPTADESRVIVGSNFNPVDDDIADEAPTASLQITHMRVRSEIALRYARTAIISKVFNPSNRPQEAKFYLILPETAFISGFTMSLGNETYDAYVKEKEVAKKIYNDAVSKGISAAHVATKARDSNHFTITFNLEGRTNVTYRLRYEEFLARRNGVYNHAINLNPGALVPKMDVVIHIKESQKISLLRVPELRTGNEIDATDKDAQNEKAIILRGRNEREATITFTPDLREQKKLAETYAEKTKQSADPESSNIGYDSAEDSNENEGVLGQFVVQYDVEQPKNGEILVNDGYFVHFFAPRSLQPLSKHVVFVLDTSGSMYGNKMEQLQKAMNAILSDLHPKDHFNIIEFNSNINVYDLKEAYEPTKSKPFHFRTQNENLTLVPPALASPENIAAAKIIVSRFRAYGGTDIYKALEVAISIVQTGVQQISETANVNETEKDNDKPVPIIIFLTDGEPTVGETDTNQIVRLLSEQNTGAKRASLFSLGFGEDSDRVFLRKLALSNEGFMRQIYEAADAALQLHDFYKQVSSPLLADVKFLYPRRQIKEESVSRHQFQMINDGSEVAVVGKIADGVNELTPQVRGYSGEHGDGPGRKLYEVNPKVPVTRDKDDLLPLERLWAYLTIKQLLDKRDGRVEGNDFDSKDSPEHKALEIALKYSFVTPLTSLVVVRLNTTDVDPVDAEAVDDPRFLPYRTMPLKKRESPSAKQTHHHSQNSAGTTYTGIKTDDGLTVDSSFGPVLFVQTTKRRITQGGGSHSQMSYGYSSSTQTHFGSNSFSHYGGGFGSHNSAYTSKYGGYRRKNNTYSYKPAFVPPETNNTGFEKVYHLEGYEWTQRILYMSEDGLKFWDNVANYQVKLKLTKDTDPPTQYNGIDTECTKNQGKLTWGSAYATTVCVYITRCHAARNITVVDYQRTYCYINSWYAGICCPRSEVDKTA